MQGQKTEEYVKFQKLQSNLICLAAENAVSSKEFKLSSELNGETLKDIQHRGNGTRVVPQG